MFRPGNFFNPLLMGEGALERGAAGLWGWRGGECALEGGKGKGRGKRDKGGAGGPRVEGPLGVGGKGAREGEKEQRSEWETG